MQEKNNSLIVNCPKCNKKLDYYASAFRPFCSRLCKLEDLASWADNSYSVPSILPIAEQDDDIIETLFEP